MKKPFHPILFAIYPVLSLYAANTALVPPRQLLWPITVVIGVVLICWLIGSGIFRNIARGALAASILVSCVFAFGHISALTSLPWASLIGGWTFGTCVLLVLACWKASNYEGRTQLFNIIGLFLVAFPLLGVVSSILRPSASAEVATEAAPSAVDKKPNIFLIVLDGYGRSDVLREKYALDDGALIRSLKSQGFRIARSSLTNYVQTQLSMASALNLEYVQDLLPDVSEDTKSRSALDNAIDNSRAAAYLKRLGYATVGIATGFPYVRFQSADLSLGGTDGSQLLRSSLLSMTPLPPSYSAGESQFEDRRVKIHAAFKNLAEVARPTAKPKFVVAHILAPHPPFVFGPNGEPRRPRGAFQLVDGSHYMESGGTREEYRRGYADQATYIGKLVQTAVSDILRISGPDTIIVIQGDHGPKGELHQDSLQETNLSEVLPILLAIRAPASVDVPEDLTPVNVFRELFSSLFGGEFPLLENKSFYSPWEQPFKFVQVSPETKKSGAQRVPLFPTK